MTMREKFGGIITLFYNEFMSFRYIPIEKDKNYALSINPTNGTAVYSSRLSNRDKQNEEITEAEIESAITSAIWKMFDDERKKFAIRQNMSELDVVLTDVRVLYIKLDGGVVPNPLGFKAKVIEVGLVETLVTRTLSEDINAKMPKRGDTSFILENASACAWALKRDSKSKEFIFANVTPSKTHLYHSDDKDGLYSLGDVSWGSDKIFAGLSSFLNVSADTAKKILNHYANEEMSQDMRKFLRPNISGLFEEFFKEMTATSLNVKIKKPLVYVMCEDLSDLETDSVSYPRSLPLKFEFLPYVSDEEIIRYEYEKASIDDCFNRIAKRRMKWLTSNH